MSTFITLHCTKVSINDEPCFEPILVNINQIVAVEHSTHKGCKSDVYLNLTSEQMPFHPLLCRESYQDILALLKEKGVEFIAP